MFVHKLSHQLVCVHSHNYYLMETVLRNSAFSTFLEFNKVFRIRVMEMGRLVSRAFAYLVCEQ